MSVILYEDQKFLDINKTLMLYDKDLAHLWEYPDYWDKGSMWKCFESFVSKLRNCNIQANNNRYNDDEPKKILNFENSGRVLNIYELIKSLKGIAYNCVEADEPEWKDTHQLLRDVIYFFMSRVLDTIPAYNTAKTW